MTSAVSVLPRVVHAIAPYTGDTPLAARQELFLQSVDQAEREGCVLLAGTDEGWTRTGWMIRPLDRNASVFGEPSSKPFLKDLLDLALANAAPGDWLFYSNVDCAITPDLYSDLRRRRATVVEYQRRDVLGDPRTLAELFSNPRTAYPLGLDALAIRAHYYEEIRERLPDFVVGEPHWDTIYSGILRRLVPVRRDSSRLLHPKHEQAWHLGHPTAAGRHNHDLFVESLEHGDSEKTTIAQDPDATDTAIVAVVFGSDPARIKANETGIREQLRQDLDADYYLVEMLSGNTASAYPDDLLALVRHVPVRGGEGAEELFQKEALQNVGWRAALAHHRYEYLIFPDADVYAEDLDWFRRIRDRLRQDPSRAVHGYRTVRDSVDPNLHYCSLGASFVFSQPNDLPLNPGICWGLCRELVEAGEGFNPLCLGAGDSAFVAEYLNTASMQYDPWLEQWTWFKEVERTLPFYAGLDCVDTDLIHVHHGYAVKRNYDGYRYAIDALPPLTEFLHLTEAGILAWNDPNGRERQLLSEQRHMNSRADVDDLLKRHGYTRQVRPRRSAKPNRARTYFRPKSTALLEAPRATGVHHGAHRKGLKIFDPDQVFRRDFPFSWCDGVVKPAGSTYIPIVDGDACALLRLDGVPGTPYVVGALPLQPNWQPQDVRGYGALAFCLRVSGTIPSDLRVTLTSMTADGREPESQPVMLDARERAGAWAPLSIPLAAFTGNGFDLDGVRLVKFSGSGCFCLELAEIYLVRDEDA